LKRIWTNVLLVLTKKEELKLEANLEVGRTESKNAKRISSQQPKARQRIIKEGHPLPLSPFVQTL
jgi:hypothetical protein